MADQIFRVPAKALAATPASSGDRAVHDSDGDWKTLMPVPTEAPKKPNTGMYSDAAGQTLYAYRNGHGELLGYVARTDRPGGKKEIRPWVFAERPDGRQEWRTQAFPEPRPLYNLDKLAAAPDATVLVVEGEKTADAASVLFPGWVAITSPSGARAAAKGDWSPLNGRTLVLWPDNDIDGRRYAYDVARQARAAGAARIALVDVPGDFPGKWDLADEAPGGWDRARLLELARAALRTSNPFLGIDPAIWVKHPFRLSDDGVDYYEEGADAEGRWVPVCTPKLEILATTRDAEGLDWGRLIRIVDRDGTTHLRAFPMSLLAGDGTALREHLLGMGLVVAQTQKARTRLSDYIATTEPDFRARCVSRIGWHGPCYVLPDRSFGEADEPVLLQTESRLDHALRTSGELARWREQVARPCFGNSRLVYALSLAFAPPLLRLIGAEGGGFHLRGGSSIGKTTALRVAGSVWGGGGAQGYIRTWRATANGLEGVALASCDGLLCLDELGEVEGRDAGATAYMLANGEGKSRARRDGSGRTPARWLVLFLSTGEQSLADKMAEANRKTNAGQEARFIDLVADAETGLGIFECLNGYPSADALARHLRAATAADYGTPIRAFLDGLCADAAALTEDVRREIRRFIEFVLPAAADGQVQRVASLFGLVAASGGLACRLGILPWTANACFEASKRLFSEWLGNRGGVGAAEAIRCLRLVRRFIEEHGDSRFARWKPDPMDRPIVNRAGVRREEDGRAEFFFHNGVLRDEVCAGLDFRTVTKALRDTGCLVMHAGGKASIAVSVPGLGKTRMYCINYQALCDAVGIRDDQG